VEPLQTHAPGLLASQDALDDGRLQQRQAQQLIDRRVVQAFALGDFAAAADYAVVEQLLPVEGPRQCHQQGLVNQAGDLARRLDRPIRPHHHLAGAAFADLQRDEGGQLDLPAIPAFARHGSTQSLHFRLHVISSEPPRFWWRLHLGSVPQVAYRIKQFPNLYF